MITIFPWVLGLIAALAVSAAGAHRPAPVAAPTVAQAGASVPDSGARNASDASQSARGNAARMRLAAVANAGTDATPLTEPAAEAPAVAPDLLRTTFALPAGPRPPLARTPAGNLRAPAALGGSVYARDDLSGVVSAAVPAAAVFPVRTEHLFFPAHIDGRDFQLEAMLYRPDDAGRHALVVFSHGRNGMYPARDPNTVNWYGEVCNALAAEGRVVAYVIRRGYGNSDGPDSELLDTAVQSGLEGAKDYAAAVAYWRTRDFVLPDRVVVMGQSQGGWVTLACTNVAMEGVLGAVNISGGTNYRLMGTGAVTSAVQDHWVAGCSELGAHALVSSFWIYAENDLSISGPTARRMYAAFTAAGGPATLLMLPPFGTNGHGVVGQPDLYLGPLDDYFAAIGFGDEPYTAPAVGPVTGADAAALGGTVILAAGVTGFPAPALQWRKDGANLANGGDLAGATAPTLQISRLAPADAGSYVLTATNALGTASSAPVEIRFPLSAPQVMTHPQNQTVTVGSGATFAVVAVGNPPPTFQWQRAPAGSNNWTNLSEGSGYTGVTGATLTIGAATAAMSGDQFRCLSTNAVGSATSSIVVLTVNAPPAEAPAPSAAGGGGAESPWFAVALLLLLAAGRRTR